MPLGCYHCGGPFEADEIGGFMHSCRRCMYEHRSQEKRNQWFYHRDDVEIIYRQEELCKFMRGYILVLLIAFSALTLPFRRR